MRPAYMTATRSHIRATIPKSCVMKSIPSPIRSCTSLRSIRYWSWMVTSSAVVGSSAMRRVGSEASAMAPTTRCFIPPLIWWGNARRRSWGAATFTRRSASSARAQRLPRPAV